MLPDPALCLWEGLTIGQQSCAACFTYSLTSMKNISPTMPIGKPPGSTGGFRAMV